MFRSNNDPTPGTSDADELLADGPEADARARRRLALLYAGGLAVLTVVMLVRGEIVQLSRPKTLDAYGLGAAIFGPVFIFIAWRVLSKGFRFCQDAVHSDDLSQKTRAIEIGLRLPAKGTLSYMAAWAIGYPLALIVPIITIDDLSRQEVVTYFTDGIAFIPLVAFPIYAIIEHEVRPLLRRLYAQTADVEDRAALRPRPFVIPVRVLLAMGSLALSMVMFLEGKTIAGMLGAPVDMSDTNELLTTRYRSSSSSSGSSVRRSRSACAGRSANFRGSCTTLPMAICGAPVRSRRPTNWAR